MPRRCMFSHDGAYYKEEARMQKQNYDDLYQRLKRPSSKPHVVLDTDTYNEIDDQFALSFLLANPERLQFEAACAAPFFNDKSTGPADGMEKSYHEILKILKLMGKEELSDRVFRGSDRYLPDEKTPVDSQAAREIIRLSCSYTAENPLYVAAIGAITNVASALLMDETLHERIFIIWLGAHGSDMQNTAEFNMMQDVASARVVFQSGAPLVLMPAFGVTSHLMTTKQELEYWLKGKNELCDYLVENTVRYCEDPEKPEQPWSKVIWDIAAIAWLLDGDYVWDRIIPAPLPEYDHRFAVNSEAQPIRYVYWLERDKIYADLFQSLGGYKK